MFTPEPSPPPGKRDLPKVVNYFEHTICLSHRHERIVNDAMKRLGLNRSELIRRWIDDRPESKEAR